MLKGRPPIYPWKKWLNRKKITLEQGKHFNCLPHSIAQQARNFAYRYGYKVSIRIHQDSITIKKLEDL